MSGELSSPPPPPPPGQQPPTQTPLPPPAQPLPPTNPVPQFPHGSITPRLHPRPPTRRCPGSRSLKCNYRADIVLAEAQLAEPIHLPLGQVYCRGFSQHEPSLPPPAQNEGSSTGHSISLTNLFVICTHREKVQRVPQSPGLHELWDAAGTISPQPRTGLGEARPPAGSPSPSQHQAPKK